MTTEYEFKGTPGEWKRRGACVLIELDNASFVEAYAGTVANANMLAASKDMFEALVALVKKWGLVEADPSYQSVWTLAMIHGQKYTGPTIEQELIAARAALAKALGK